MQGFLEEFIQKRLEKSLEEFLKRPQELKKNMQESLRQSLQYFPIHGDTFQLRERFLIMILEDFLNESVLQPKKQSMEDFVNEF